MMEELAPKRTRISSEPGRNTKSRTADDGESKIREPPPPHLHESAKPSAVALKAAQKGSSNTETIAPKAIGPSGNQVPRAGEGVPAYAPGPIAAREPERAPSVPQVATQPVVMKRPARNMGPPSSKKVKKKSVCPFCGAEVYNLNRHYDDQHENEPEVPMLKKGRGNPNFRRG